MQNLIVVGIVVLALFFLIRHFYKAFNPKPGDSCGCRGCSGCSSVRDCAPDRLTEIPPRGEKRDPM